MFTTVPGRIAATVGCLVASALAWGLWMEVGHDENADYEVWRVVGLVVTLALIGLPLFRLAGRIPVIAALPLGLAVAAYYSWRGDDTGLFAVGVLMVYLGSLVVTAVIGALAGKSPAGSNS